MTKLPENNKFIDLSDYARKPALLLVKWLMPTKVGAYTLTTAFLIIGILASLFIAANKYLIIASVLILIKSMLDAADGEIARQRNEQSMVGRYYDSVSDFIVNMFLFLSISLSFSIELWHVIIPLILFQLQGSVYNYYYLVKRYQVNGDQTSRIFEKEVPKPFLRDNVLTLKIFHKLYLLIYGWQDYIVHKLDAGAIKTKDLPNWFLTLTSILGLGFQLLIISVLIIFELHEYTFSIFIFPYTFLTILIITVRKLFIK